MDSIRAVDKHWDAPDDFAKHRKEIDAVQTWLKVENPMDASKESAKTDEENGLASAPKEAPKTLVPVNATTTTMTTTTTTTGLSPKITRQATWRGRKTQAAENDEKDIVLEGPYAKTGAIRRADTIKIDVSSSCVRSGSEDNVEP